MQVVLCAGFSLRYVQFSITAEGRRRDVVAVVASAAAKGGGALATTSSRRRQGRDDEEKRRLRCGFGCIEKACQVLISSSLMALLSSPY